MDWSGANEYLSAGLDVSARYAINEVPIFVRAGSVVPLRNNLSLTQTVAFSDPLVWSVWLGERVGEGNGTVVEDDGATERFSTDGAMAVTRMMWSRSSVSARTVAPVITLVVNATVGSFDVPCSAENGYEYAGDGADLQDIGVVISASECCSSCSTFSNCAYWTWATDTKRCMLKVSRRGRRVNASAVSGVAPRRMPPARAHGFQLRSPRFATLTTPLSVTVNGKPLPKIAATEDGMAGWYIQPSAVTGLSRVPSGALVILTEKISLNRGIVVQITEGGAE
jgi:hypothetical protein